MKVSDVNESELLSRFLPILNTHNQQAQRIWAEKFGTASPLSLGPGDDAAVLRIPAYTVSTIDTQTQNQDFRKTWASGAVTSGYDVGWKAAAQNLGDVAAMGATPVSFLVSLTLTPDTDVDWVSDFATGICDSLVVHEIPWCTIAGGDLGRGTEISVTVAASGTCEKPLLRSNAQAGDVLAIAGDLGTAAAGLALLDSVAFELGESAQLDALVAGQQRPIAAVVAGMNAENAHAMMDISDGPIRDAERIANASNINIEITAQALSLDVEKVMPAAQFLVSYDEHYADQEPEELALFWCLTGGENHGMLATFAADDVAKGFRVVGSCFAPFGDATPAVTVDHFAYRGKGWDHFEA